MWTIAEAHKRPADAADADREQHPSKRHAAAADDGGVQQPGHDGGNGGPAKRRPPTPPAPTVPLPPKPPPPVKIRTAVDNDNGDHGMCMGPCMGPGPGHFRDFRGSFGFGHFDHYGPTSRTTGPTVVVVPVGQMGLGGMGHGMGLGLGHMPHMPVGSMMDFGFPPLPPSPLPPPQMRMGPMMMGPMMGPAPMQQQMQMPHMPPPGWQPREPEGPPPGWQPREPEGPPPGWQQRNPEGPQSGWTPRTPQPPPGPPPGWSPRPRVVKPPMIDLTNEDVRQLWEPQQQSAQYTTQPPMPCTMPEPLRAFFVPPPRRPPPPPPPLESEEQEETPQWAQPVPAFGEDGDGSNDDGHGGKYGVDGSTPVTISDLGAASPQTPPKLPAMRPKPPGDDSIPGPKTPPRRRPPIATPTGPPKTRVPGRDKSIHSQKPRQRWR